MLRWFRRRRRQEQPTTADTDLERFFTDAEEARERFQGLVASPMSDRRIMVVHGIGAVGKSSLLRMYRLACRRQQIPVALVGGEEAPSVVDLLDRWTTDLSADVDMPAIASSLARYRKLQARVEEFADKAGEAQADAANKLTTATAKVIVTAAASAIPIAGPIAGPIAAAVGSEGVEAVLNLLRAKLSRSDYDFFLDPTTRLTDDFLADLGRVAARQRIVLMLDTYESITTLSDWLRKFVQGLPANVLFVVAGRVAPDWDRAWPGWVGRAEIIELREMSDEDIDRLVHQYYSLFGRGEPEPGQVTAVVRFARGLPMAATTAVRLWVSYQVTDLQPVGQGAVADLADRLLEGVPAEMRPAFEAAAVLRYFNVDSLAAVLDGTDTAGLYDELRRWPFTRPRSAELAVHDTMREVITDALRARSPELFRQLNERASAHYARLLATAGSEERERLQLEWLYHSIRADEAAGVKQFQEVAETLVRHQWVGRLRALMNDINTYPLRIENSRLWRRYYAARLDHIEGRVAVAEAEYLAIGNHDEAESRLRAYALCDLGTIYVAFDRLSEADGERRARDVIDQSQVTHPELDPKLVTNQVSLMNLSNTRAAWAESLEHLRPMRAFAESTSDAYSIVTVNLLESTIHGLLGDWVNYLRARRSCEETLRPLGDVPALQMQVAYFTWPLIYMGRYREAHESSERALKLAIRLEEKELMITILESTALALGMQEAYIESAQRFAEAWNFYENFHLAGSEQGTRNAERYIRALLSFRGLVALREGRLDVAEADLLHARRIKRQIQDRIGMPELHVWGGVLAELRGAWDDAETAYKDALELRSVNRRYFEAAAWTGLVRLNYARGRYGNSAEAIGAAEEIAERYQYNDLLASLRLFQGHLVWEGRDGGQRGADAVFAHYQEALVFALRYNRYLLDEVLQGRAQGTALVPIIPTCLNHGSAGRNTLHRLQEWWRSGTNDLQPQREENVSPLKVGLPLIEAERDARNRERDAGVPQRSVLERISEALGSG